MMQMSTKTSMVTASVSSKLLSSITWGDFAPGHRRTRGEPNGSASQSSVTQ